VVLRDSVEFRDYRLLKYCQLVRLRSQIKCKTLVDAGKSFIPPLHLCNSILQVVYRFVKELVLALHRVLLEDLLEELICLAVFLDLLKQLNKLLCSLGELVKHAAALLLAASRKLFNCRQKRLAESQREVLLFL